MVVAVVVVVVVVVVMVDEQSLSCRSLFFLSLSFTLFKLWYFVFFPSFFAQNRIRCDIKTEKEKKKVRSLGA